MNLEVDQIYCIESAMRENSRAVAVECFMTETQMFALLRELRRSVSDATFDLWVEQTRPVAIEISDDDLPF